MRVSPRTVPEPIRTLKIETEEKSRITSVRPTGGKWIPAPHSHARPAPRGVAPVQIIPAGRRSIHQEAGRGSAAHRQRLDSFLRFPRNLKSIAFSAKLAKIGATPNGDRMQTLSAKDAKYGFGRLIDFGSAESIVVTKPWAASCRNALGRGIRAAEGAGERRCRRKRRERRKGR